MNDKNSFSYWMITHESECRNLTKCTFARNKGAVRFGIDADDLWHETFHRLAKSNCTIESSRDLFGLVKTVATRIIQDKARRYTIRKPLFDKPEVTTTSDAFIDEPSDPYPRPDEAMFGEEQLQLLHDVAVCDSSTHIIFHAICELIDANVQASVANISRHLGKPYSQVRAGHMKLQMLIRKATTEGQLEIAKKWLA